MSSFVKNLIWSAVIGLAFAEGAAAVQIEINPGAYSGVWSVDYGPDQTGAAYVDLHEVDATTGFHVVSLGGTEFFFSVSPDGEVIVENTAAADGGRGVIRFNTTMVYVDPANHIGPWQVTDAATPKLQGPQLVTLVRGLQFYGLEVGAIGAFFFDIGPRGRVTVHQPLAGTGGRINLRQVPDSIAGKSGSEESVGYLRFSERP